VRQASAQWPPPENELQYGYGPGGRLQVQWPPTGQDEQEQKQVVAQNDSGKIIIITKMILTDVNACIYHERARSKIGKKQNTNKL
jgi:hypothetical protein